jgi:hypothetical protein
MGVSGKVSGKVLGKVSGKISGKISYLYWMEQNTAVP